jgi:hypothetical protein
MKPALVRLLAIAGLAGAVGVASGLPDAAAGGLRIVDVDLGPGAESIQWLRRAAGSGRDLLVHAGRQLRVYARRGPGAPPRSSRELPLPPDTSFLDAGDLDGEGADVVVAVSHRGVFAANLAGEENAFRSLLPPPALPPEGGGIPVLLDPVRVRLIEDLSDERGAELLVPVRGGFVLYRRLAGELRETAFLEGQETVVVDPGGPEIVSPLRMEARVPRLRFKDLNGDGRRDIVSTGDDGIRAYLQGASGFSPRPSYYLDLAGLRALEARSEAEGRAPARDVALPGASGVRVHEDDIDGDGVVDYLVAAGTTLHVYFGEREGVDFSRPSTLLKFSSELRGVGSFDTDGDGRRDIVALRFELPSLPRFLAAYFVATSIDFEVLGYRNEGGRRFARRPTRRNTLSLNLPPLRRLVEDFAAVAERFLGQVEKRSRHAAGDLDGDGRADAAFLDDDGRLRVFLARGGETSPVREPVLGDLLFDTGKREWGLEELLDHVAGARFAARRRAVAGRPADLELEASGEIEREHLAMEIADIDGDGRGDIALRTTREALRLYLSAPE